MTEEKHGFKFTTDFTDQSKFDGDFTTYFTEEKINQFQQEFEQLNQKYLPRAQAILSADQFEQFKKFLTAQAEMQKLGFKMAAKMFGPHSAN